MKDDDMPEMPPSRAAVHEVVSRARAILKAAAAGKTLWDVVDEYTLDALVELRWALSNGDDSRRFAAADRLAAIWTKMPPRPALPPQAGVTPEEREQRMVEAEQDAGVRAWLQAKGWTPPKERKEAN